jgi:hypothetical protein
MYVYTYINKYIYMCILAWIYQVDMFIFDCFFKFDGTSDLPSKIVRQAVIPIPYEHHYLQRLARFEAIWKSHKSKQPYVTNQRNNHHKLWTNYILIQ